MVRLTRAQMAAIKAKQRQSPNFIRDKMIDREFREQLKEAKFKEQPWKHCSFCKEEMPLPSRHEPNCCKNPYFQSEEYKKSIRELQR